MITTQLDSIGPKHYNTKILQTSLFVLSFAKFETMKATQRFLFCGGKLAMSSFT
jgi:hypothetical protein